MSDGAVSAQATSMGGHGGASPFTRTLHSVASDSESTFPTANTQSFFTRSLHSDSQVPRGMKLSRNTTQPGDNSARSNSKSNEKGKQPIHGDILVDTGAQHYGSEHYVPSPYRTRPSTTDGNPNGRSRFRGSILVAASDALGFKFGRRRPSIRQPPTPIILPDVIEISASRADLEVEERNRLREMAAQAIGLGPFMVTPTGHSRDDSATDEDDEGQTPMHDSIEIRRLEYVHNSESAPNIAGRSPHNSSLSVVIPQQYQQPPPTPGGRFRSGSMATHNQSDSTTIAPIPAFPSTLSSLKSFRQRGGTYSKYYPPSSLRIFALSKNWKNRFLILSSPATIVTRGQGPAVSYLHLFKSANPEETELERLEINEDSVVFVSEEEVGGKRQVIKIGGVDVGAMKKEYMHEEGGHSMWLLQITDQADAQKWITNIKNAILGQRTVRAGLIPAHTIGGNEPRGDMDVMLSIRAQNLVTSPSSPTSKSTPIAGPVYVPYGETSPNYASSISSRSARSQTTVPKPASPTTSAVSALKGLFANSNRPRSASRAASIDSERQQDRDGGDESFASMGSNLLNMLRSSTPDTHSVNTIPSSPPRTNLPFAGGPNDRRLDRKIMTERPLVQWASSENTTTLNRANRALSLGALSLQPPPRKRWTSIGPMTPIEKQTEDSTNSKHDSMSLSRTSTDRAETEPPSSPTSGVFQFGTPEQRPRAPSLQSVSTYGSKDNAQSFERSSSSTKRSSGTRSARRWSRQGILPNRLTPPSVPPPAPPTNQSTSLVVHPYGPERAPSPISSRGSQKSTVSELPSFSKRASGSESVYSASSFSTSQSHGAPSNTSNHNGGSVVVRPSSAHRTSFPPPRPAPTSALPPAPTETNDEASEDVLKPLESIPGASKSSFRTSVAHRTFRMSMVAPKPPPSTTLPPRPDEPDHNIIRTHRRSSSGSGSINGHSTKLESIPASPIPALITANPFPPPRGPLPPPPPPLGPLPPPPSSTSSGQQLPPPKRTTSLKQRLRILSAPSPSSSNGSLSGRHQLPRMSVPPSQLTSTILSMSPPATPIAEKITLFQNDPSFLQMHTPVMQPLPQPQSILPQPPLSSQDQEIAGITSLSPPPRRGSKQLLDTDFEGLKNSAVHSQESPTPDDEPKRFSGSMSCPGSPVSQQGSELLIEGDFGRAESISSPVDMPTPDEKLPSPIEPRHLGTSRPGSVVSLGIMSM